MRSLESYLKNSVRPRTKRNHGKRGKRGERKNEEIQVWTLDFETDPFRYGRKVEPFACDVFDGNRHHTFWGDDCISSLVAFLHRQDGRIVIYAHNGGRFDFMFLRKFIQGKLLFIGSRLVRGDFNKKVEFRDSYSCLPVPLAQMDKQAFDYTKLEKENREKYKESIIEYLHGDTKYLWEWITKWRAEFGDKLTMASAAMSKFKGYDYRVETMIPRIDAAIRPYYFGGRVQCIAGAGEFAGNLKLYDVNSMYPSVMRDFLHPVSAVPIFGNRIGKNTFFVDVEGVNYGAFLSLRDHKYDYTVRGGRFKTTIHEFRAAEELGLFRCKRVHQTVSFLRSESFSEFIEDNYARRLAAIERKDASDTLFRKLVMNSTYGKFGQNPENYTEIQVVQAGEELDGELCKHPGIKLCKCGGWKFYQGNMVEGWNAFERPAVRDDGAMESGYYNVAVSASITGAARAMMLRGLAGATRPLYCDTDSIFCESLAGVLIDSKALGAWKLEAEGNMLAVGGKKLYAFRKLDGSWKTARKGCKLDPEEIVSIVRGETVTYQSTAPMFKFFGSEMQLNLERKIKRTV